MSLAHPVPKNKFIQNSDTPSSYSGQLGKILRPNNAETALEFLTETVNVNSYASFSAAIAAIGATETTLLIPDQQTVSTNETVPSTMELRFLRGGSLSVDAGKIVTISGPPTAGLWQIFEGAGSVVLGTDNATRVYPQWWGALADGSTDDYAAMNKAFLALPSIGGQIYWSSTGLPYMCSQTLDWQDKPIDIVFENGEASPLKATTGFSGGPLMKLYGQATGDTPGATGTRLQKCNIIGLRIDGNGRTPSCDGLEITWTDNFHIEEVYIYDCRGMGLLLRGSREGNTDQIHIDNCGEMITTGTATGTQTANTLQDTSKAFTTDANQNYYVIIDGPTVAHGNGQVRRILSNDSDTLTIFDNTASYHGIAWDTPPVTTSTTYMICKPSLVIEADGDTGTVGGGSDAPNNIDFNSTHIILTNAPAILVFGVGRTTSFCRNIRSWGGFFHGPLSTPAILFPLVYFSDCQRNRLMGSHMSFWHGIEAIIIAGLNSPNENFIHVSGANGVANAVGVNVVDGQRNVLDWNSFNTQGTGATAVIIGPQADGTVIGPNNIVIATTDITDNGTNTKDWFTAGPVTGAVLADGTVPLTADWDIGAFELTADQLKTYKNNSDNGSIYSLLLEQDGTGDVALRFTLTGIRSWNMGIDNSDGDAFKIARITDGGWSGTQLRLDVSGDVHFEGASQTIARIGSTDNDRRFEMRMGGSTTQANMLMDPLPDAGTQLAQVSFFRITNTSGTRAVVFYKGDGSASISHSIGIDGGDVYFNNLGGDFGIGVTNPSAKLHVDQSSTTGAAPVLYLDQADVSEEMIEFNTTIGVGNAIEAIGAKTLTTTHFIKVTLPGSATRYIPCGTIA